MSEQTIEGGFLGAIEKFLVNKTLSQSHEDLEGRRYFLLKNFEMFLRSEGWCDISRNQITRRVRALGGGIQVISISDKPYTYWWVPVSGVPI